MSVVQEGTATVKLDGRRVRGARTRVRIVDSAADLFRARGFHGVSLEEIATAAGISGPAIYRHFDSKEDVLDAVIAPGLDAFMLPLEPSSGDPHSTLWNFFDRLARFSAEQPGIVALAHQEWRNLASARREAIRTDLGRRFDVLGRNVRLLRSELTVAEARLLVGAAVTVASYVGFPGSGRPVAPVQHATMLRDLAIGMVLPGAVRR